MFLAGQEIKNPLASVIIIIYTKSEGGNVFLGAACGRILSELVEQFFL